MRINKKYCTIVEWIVAIVLIVMVCYISILSYGSFFPVKAHQESEKTYHYGPSKIIKTINLDGEKIFLCRYKDWFSADTVKRGIIRWYPGDQVGGTPIDYSKQVSFSWGDSSNGQKSKIMKVYGYASDPKITTMLLEEENGTNILRYDLDESRMFIFYWKEDSQKYKIVYLKGLNKDGQIIYEEKAY